MAIRIFRRKPAKVPGTHYQGTVAEIDHLVSWVRHQSPRQSLEPEGEDGRLVLAGPDGTYDLYVGWYLIFEDDQFKVLDPDEFNENYEEI